MYTRTVPHLGQGHVSLVNQLLQSEMVNMKHILGIAVRLHASAFKKEERKCFCDASNTFYETWLLRKRKYAATTSWVTLSNLAARVLLYAPPSWGNTRHGVCYTSRGAECNESLAAATWTQDRHCGKCKFSKGQIMQQQMFCPLQFDSVREGRKEGRKEGKKEMFYLMMQEKHFNYPYMASDT